MKLLKTLIIAYTTTLISVDAAGLPSCVVERQQVARLRSDFTECTSRANQFEQIIELQNKQIVDLNTRILEFQNLIRRAREEAIKEFNKRVKEAEKRIRAEEEERASDLRKTLKTTKDELTKARQDLEITNRRLQTLMSRAISLK